MISRIAIKCLGFAAVLVAVSANVALATPAVAPEIDPTSMTTALAMLVGTGFLVADQVRRRIAAK